MLHAFTPISGSGLKPTIPFEYQGSCYTAPKRETMKTVLPNSSLAFIPPLGFTYSKTRDDFRSSLLVPVVGSVSLA